MEKSHEKTWVEYVYIDHKGIWIAYALMCWMIVLVDGHPNLSLLLAISSSVLGFCTCVVGLWKFHKERRNEDNE